ncbi:MAG TPA: protein translocase subunit SecF [bacterium]|nr:protein translocase subunit SecF [bacterium]HPT29339.1 protein translocase subunit SecF [bacterium]
MTYRIIQKGKIWISISIVLVILAITAISMWGLKMGIDFTGGSLLEAKFIGQNQPNTLEVQDALKGIELNSLTIQPAETSFILRFQESSEDIHQKVLVNLKKLAAQKNKEANNFEELNFTSIGPSIGQEMQRKAISAIILVLIAISVYIAFAFRKVSKPVASWKYGSVTLIALFHDVLIVIGFFAILGHFWGVEVNTSFVAAILTVLGFSVHDTIVVFDRVRENLPKSDTDFENTVNRSVNQTLVRSVNTSMTVILVMLAIVLFGGASIKYFSLALLVGVFFGTYSSIFLASPLLVIAEKMQNKKKK